MVKCPVCHSPETRAGLGDKSSCTDCGAIFDSQGNVQEVRGPFVVGNLADLQRGGAAAFDDGVGSSGDEVTAVGPKLAVHMEAAPEADEADDGSKPSKATHATKKH